MSRTPNEDIIQGVPNANPETQKRISSSSATLSPGTDQNEEIVITNIRATDVSLGMKLIPAGFYTIVHHNGLEWKTENKRVTVNNNILEWRGLIPIPSDLSCTVRLEVYASFEFQPMLGSGERLRRLAVTVKQLLDRSAEGGSFSFTSKDGGPASPCLSLFVAVAKQKKGGKVLEPHSSILGQLEKATNEGHSALSRYQKRGAKRDLEGSVEQFEFALSVCPRDHPGRAAAQANLAMAKFFLCQTGDPRVSFDVPLALYRNALSCRPVGHIDRPSTLIYLAKVHIARFKKRQDESDSKQAQALLREAVNVSSAASYEHRIATCMLQPDTAHRSNPARPGVSSSPQREVALGFKDEDLWTSSVELLERFEQFGDTDDLQSGISILEALLKSTSVKHKRYLGMLSNFSTALLCRFKHVGEPSDLERAILTAQEVVFAADGDPAKPTYLNNLGTCFLERFHRHDELSDLGHAISRFEDAAKQTPKSDPDKSVWLMNLGNALLSRFKRLGELSDLERGTQSLCVSADLFPNSHSKKPHCLSNLGNSLLARFKRLGDLADLEQAISRYKDAVDSVPDCHPDKPGFLSNLGISFFHRFKRLGVFGDLEQAVSIERNVVTLTPNDHPDKAHRMSHLGLFIFERFQHLGDLSDLELAVSIQRNAVDLTPDGHPSKRIRLGNLASSVEARFERLGNSVDLDQAVAIRQDVVFLTPDDDSGKKTSLYNLGNLFKIRFERFGNLVDLDQSVLKSKDAVDLTPDDHPDKPLYLNGLGNALGNRFERFGELSDLKQAILRFTDAVDRTPDSHPLKSIFLFNLGNSLKTRSDHVGDIDDLHRAIFILGNANDLIPDNHPAKHTYQHSLGTSFLKRFNRIGEPDDLERAISRIKDAIDHTPDDHPDKLRSICNLGISFKARHERIGQLADLEQAISWQEVAIGLIPDDHPEKPFYLSSLSSSLFSRFERLGRLSDLEQAIHGQRNAIILTPDDHPQKADYLSSLGTSFGARFMRLGELSDLEQAILTLRSTVVHSTDGHPDKPFYLNTLGTLLFSRFRRLGELSDLDQAIETFRDAVNLTPVDHPHKPRRLNNLGNSLTLRFQRNGDLDDLEKAITRQRDAVGLTPDGHSLKPNHLNNLGCSLLTRYEHLGELTDLDCAIASHQKAIELTSDGHPFIPAILVNLSNSFSARFDRLGESNDLEQAISGYRTCVDLTPDGHADKAGYLLSLGYSFRSRYKHLEELGDLEQAISAFSLAASASAGAALYRFHASLQWISCAHILRHSSLLDAYSSSISLLPQLAWIGLSLTHRYRELMQGADMVREAAAAALDAGFPKMAVEWLEQGRAIVWGELFQLRSSYDELSTAHPDHARRLRNVSTALEQAGVAREESLSPALELADSTQRQAMESLEQEASKHRALAIERDKLVQEIRGLPGFERFLLHKEYSQLRAAAHSGPVVILNAAKTRCDALIILAGVEDVIHVPIPNFTLSRMTDLHASLNGLVRGEREGHPMLKEHISQWESILSALWKCIVKPVLDTLAILTPGKYPRISWCPTGPFTFLPIHAAGYYDSQYSELGHKIFDFVVSSYVPTLSILIPPKLDVSPTENLNFLVVHQPKSDGLSPLPGVEVELKHIETVIGNLSSPQTTLLKSTAGTVEEVLELMKGADWVHFACHGIQDASSPTDSGLCLADGRRLKLSNIIALSRPRGGLAFLSACQTATGDKELSDESIHIAAGMLFAGYGSVVGTMWSISDKLAPIVARDVYEQLFQDGVRPDYRKAAIALQGAVRRLRDNGASFGEWLPFIHVGL